MRSVVRRMASILFFPLFIWSKLYNYHARGRIITLILHDLSDRDIARFKKVIEFLSKHFRFITPEQFEEMHLSGNIPKGISFLITFDDGFVSSKRAAECVLDPLDIKAAFFCCGSFINMPTQLSKHFVADRIYQKTREADEIKAQEAPMSVQDVRDLVSKGHMIGCHTDTHPVLSAIDDRDALAKDFLHSKTRLAEISGREIKWFAYPFGRLDCVNRQSFEVIRSHYKFCFSGIGGDTDPSKPYSLTRTCLTLQDPYYLQLALILGAANPYYWRRRKQLERLSASDDNKYCYRGQRA
ncbi:MAG TPA: polysaccharide deacetylase family protein [Methanosarcina sp.]|nr:polysaccharide deacetylase family protein [Methanosarcina sp.]